ncbi:MAG: flavin reductase family protein [Eubacteriales bacterium]|nr:flavin reductase family protein [Eubacteriales bacterium]
MRKNFESQSWIHPMPVLIVGTYGADGTPDAMNAAWGGVYDTGLVMLCLAHEHVTTANIRARKAFTVSFADAPHVAAADYVGLVSAAETPDKVARAGWHVLKAQTVDAPLFEELPLALECELVKFNEDGIVVGRIVSVSADESLLDENGRLDTDRMEAVVFDGVADCYRRVGEKVADAFSAGRQIG